MPENEYNNSHTRWVGCAESDLGVGCDGCNKEKLFSNIFESPICHKIVTKIEFSGVQKK